MSPIPLASDLEPTGPAVTYVTSASENGATSDLSPLSLGHVINELVVLEDVHRALDNRASGAAAARERRRLTARQRVVLRELRHRARHRVRLRPATPDARATPDPGAVPELDHPR
jgi:hypothetical protein